MKTYTGICEKIYTRKAVVSSQTNIWVEHYLPVISEACVTA